MSSLARNTFLFSGFTILSRITGLMNMMAFNAVLGSGRADRLSDSYHLAHTIPNILYEFIIGGLLSAIFIPLLVREQEKHGHKSDEAWRAANLLLGLIGLVLAIVSVLAAFAAPQIVWALTFIKKSASDASSRELAVYFLRYFAPIMFFYGLNAVFMAILNSHNVFGITAAAPIINNLVVFVTLLAFRAGYIGITGLAIGTTAGVAVMALSQIPSLIKVGMPFRPRISLRDEMLKSLTGLGAPLLLLSLANFAGTAIRANLLWSVPGGYTAYNNSFRLVMMPYGIFAVSIATVLYPAMSRFAASADIPGFRDSFSRGIRWTTLITLPTCLGMALLAEPLIRVLFERGRFRYSDTLFNASFFRIYALTILPYSLGVFASRAFYAMKDTISPTWINVSGVIVGTILNFVLLEKMGANGIAVSSVVMYTGTFAVNMWWLRRKAGRLDARKLLQSSLKFAVAAAAMALVVFGAKTLTEPEYIVVQGSRTFAGQLPRGYDSGAAVVIRDNSQWDQFWSLSQSTKEPPPPIDFDHRSVIAIFGPASSTSISLELADVKSTTSTADLSVLVHKPAAKPGQQASISRPFIITLLNKNVTAANAQFEVTDKPQHRFSKLQAREAIRLAILIALGALTYFGVCMMLRTEELSSILQIVRRKLGRKNAPAEE